MGSQSTPMHNSQIDLVPCIPAVNHTEHGPITTTVEKILTSQEEDAANAVNDETLGYENKPRKVHRSIFSE